MTTTSPSFTERSKVGLEVNGLAPAQSNFGMQPTENLPRKSRHFWRTLGGVKMMQFTRPTQEPDLEVELTLFPTDQGGRKYALWQGCRLRVPRPATTTW